MIAAAAASRRRGRAHISAAAFVVAALAPAAAASQSAELRLAPVEPTPVAADLERGRRLYDAHCSQCHGAKGKGDGPAADLVYPRPRDFTLALFKIRTTPSGQVPTDHDLFKTISEGLPGTSMPAWGKYLSESERWQLVHYVKTFDEIGVFKDEPAKQRIVITKPPAVTPELLAKGRQVYQEKKCGQCHGTYGRGDGPSARGLKDDWGFAIRPVDFTKSWRFRGGAEIADIYRTFTTGFNGTPMPSFAKAIAEDDRWALAAYVKSLARPMQTGQVLKARYWPGEIPADPQAPAWEAAALLDVPLAGQIIVEPRLFTPAHDVITAKALYNDREAAILLIWDDGTNNATPGERPMDRAAVQLPAGTLQDGEKPYFILGDRKSAVDYWVWRADGTATRFTAHGRERIAARPLGGLVVQGGYKDGQYRVILRRQLRAQDKGEATLEPGRFVPVAFHLWDGEQGEDGLRMALSTWYSLLLAPPTPVSAYLWPAGIGLLVFLWELWLIRRQRRVRPTRSDEETST